MELIDFVEVYYKNGDIDIIRVKGVDWYFLRGGIDLKGRPNAICELSSEEEAKKIINREISVKKLMNERYKWVPFEAFARFLTKDHLREIARRAEAEDRAKAANEEANKKRDEGEER